MGLLHNHQHLPRSTPPPSSFFKSQTGRKRDTFFLWILSTEWTMLSQPLSSHTQFCFVFCRGHLLTSCCSAIMNREASLQSDVESGNLMIHPIKYLFTGHKPTSAMRVSEAWEWPQSAHTLLYSGIPDSNILFLHHVVLNTDPRQHL